MNRLGQILFAFALLVVGLPLTAQVAERPTVTGTVIDYANQPIGDVLVFIDGGVSPVVTQAVGAFRLEVPTPGPHALNFRKAGYAPRTFRLPDQGGEAGRLDVGVIQLQPGPAPTGTVGGRVVDAISKEPVSGALISINGNTIAVSNASGVFTATRIPLVWGPNQFNVRHLSYAEATDDVWVANVDDALAYDVALIPVPVATTPEIVVEVDRTLMVYGRMRPFYQRRNIGRGDFFTRQEIEERNPRQLTDVFETVPGIELREIGLTGMQITFSRAARGLRDACDDPVIYLDGVRIQGGLYLNEIVLPEMIEGIEIYQGITEIPAEFMQPGQTCGVIVIWTR